MTELADALNNLHDERSKWVIKAEFGMSARERIVGAGRVLPPPAQAWVEKRFAVGEPLFFEPWLDRLAEAGLQFSLPPSGEPILVGVTPMLADASGVYRGSRFHVDAAVEVLWMDSIEIGFRVAKRAQSVGYFGPLGIDVMAYRDTQGELRIRPIQDVNARYTMGRLALGLRRLLAPGQLASWVHAQLPAADSSPRRHLEDVASALPPGTRFVRTSPLEIDGRPATHATMVLIAESKPHLRAAETLILGDDIQADGGATYPWSAVET
jgi:hypothetical protein